MGAQKQTAAGNTTQNATRSPNPQQRGLYDQVIRALMGQLSAPPETPISVPLQQAVSNAQGGLPAMRQTLGLGGGLVNRLTGHDGGGGALLPPTLQAQRFGGSPSQYTQAGLQSRADLGIPDRKASMDPAGFIPSPEELQALGAVPTVRSAQSGARTARRDARLERREERLTDRIERRQAKGKKTGKAEKRLAKVQDRRSDIAAGGN